MYFVLSLRKRLFIIFGCFIIYFFFFYNFIEGGRYEQCITAITTYSKDFVRIEKFDESKNMESKFSLHSGENITYRKYYSQKLNENENNIKSEKCLIKFGRNYYPPQYLMIIANNDLQTDDTKASIRSEFSNLPASKIINESIELNKNLSYRAIKTNKIFEIDFKSNKNTDNNNNNNNNSLYSRSNSYSNSYKS